MFSILKNSSQNHEGYYLCSSPVFRNDIWVSPFPSKPNDPNSSDYILHRGRFYKILDMSKFKDPIDLSGCPENPSQDLRIFSCCNNVIKTVNLKEYLKTYDFCLFCKTEPIEKMFSFKDYTKACAIEFGKHMLASLAVIGFFRLFILVFSKDRP